MRAKDGVGMNEGWGTERHQIPLEYAGKEIKLICYFSHSFQQNIVFLYFRLKKMPLKLHK